MRSRHVGFQLLPACNKSCTYLWPENPIPLKFVRRIGGAVLVGYMRVSTAEQNLALQRDALLVPTVTEARHTSASDEWTGQPRFVPTGGDSRFNDSGY